MFNPRGRGRGGGSGLALGLLLAQMANVGFDRIPPVTLAVIVGQVAIFLQLFSHYWAPSIASVCVSALRVWYQDDWARLLLATFFHADEWHLYFNMVSMLWKGVSLERRFGSVYFLAMLASFSVLTNVVLVALSLLADFALQETSFVTQCAVGFSGVLFALKVVKNHADPPGTEYIMNMIPVPTKIACWAELILIHFLVPNSSFVGHLAGILVGLLYILGPLKWILDAATAVFLGMRAPSYTYHRAATGTRLGGDQAWTSTTDYAPERRRSGVNTDRYNQYTGGMSEEEQLNRATEESIRGYYSTQPTQMPMPDYEPRPSAVRPAPPTGPVYPREGPDTVYRTGSPSMPQPDYSVLDQEALRRRRLERFDQRHH